MLKSFKDRVFWVGVFCFFFFPHTCDWFWVQLRTPAGPRSFSMCIYIYIIFFPEAIPGWFWPCALDQCPADEWISLCARVLHTPPLSFFTLHYSLYFIYFPFLFIISLSLLFLPLFTSSSSSFARSSCISHVPPAPSRPLSFSSIGQHKIGIKSTISKPTIN